MGFKGVISVLNELVKKGKIEDYAIGGGYAVMYYEIPISTFDMDVLVLLSSENDFHELYEYFRRNNARIEDVYIYIDEMPVQFLPNYIGPLFTGAIKEAIEVEFEGIYTKFASIEYLIAMLLTAYRPKDKIRVQSLIGKADQSVLIDIIQRYDDDKRQLYSRYKKILGRAPEG